MLSDSRVAIMAVQNAATCGSASTVDWKTVGDPIRQWAAEGVNLRLGGVKTHLGFVGNEGADGLGKAECLWKDPMLVTEGGRWVMWSRLRARDRVIIGLGENRVSRWSRRAVSKYVQGCTEKGD